MSRSVTAVAVLRRDPVFERASFEGTLHASCQCHVGVTVRPQVAACTRERLARTGPPDGTGCNPWISLPNFAWRQLSGTIGASPAHFSNIDPSSAQSPIRE